MSTLICLGGGIEGLPILERAKALGHRLVVVDGNQNAPGMARADVSVVASCYDPIATVDAIHLGYHPDGVLCCAVDAPNVAAFVAREFDLPGLTPDQAAMSVNKLEQKAQLRWAGLPVPDFHGWARIVVKPPDSRGARGVKLIETGGVVEEWLDGPQLSTESIIQDGCVLWTGIAHRNYIRLQEFAPYIIEDGYEEPHGDARLLASVNSVLKRACAALGWYQVGGGTVKGDLILHEGRVVVLELAARLSGGFLATHGHPLAYGVDFVGAAIEMALGNNWPIWPTQPSGFESSFVCQRYVFPEPGDIGRRVVSVAGILLPATTMVVRGAQLEHPTRHGSYKSIGADFATYAIHPGDVIQPVTSHASRWGQATCTGATPEQAQMRAIAAVDAMKKAVVLE